MIANIDFIKDRFNTYNRLMFSGLLPLPIIRTGKARRSLGTMKCSKNTTASGKTECRNFAMTISTAFDLPENELEDVVIHEMIHYFIMYRKIKDTSPHGTIFRQIMHKINTTYGRDICISRKGSPISQTATPKPHYICISQLADGRTGITIAPKTRIFQLWKDIPRLFNTKSEKWYWTNNPFFNKYPAALKPKIYIIDNNELQPQLKKAIELQNNGRVIKRKQMSND